MNIRDKDLNLLAVFLIIGEELNLSRACVRLGLSQPALSHALARLREQFGDPLFVRGQRGLVATPRVSALLPKVRAFLDAAAGLYGPGEALDLISLDRKVVIAATTYFEVPTIARFIITAQAQAPRLQIETQSLSGGFPKRELETGEFDLAVAVYFDEPPAGFHSQAIFTDRFVCVCSKGNSYLKTRQTMVDYLGCRHLQIEVPLGTFAPADQALQEKGKRREIALRIGNFLTPPVILAQSDHLLTCPLRLAENYRTTHRLVITELPFRLPTITAKMVWHEKNEQDPFHRWLRACLARVDQSSGATKRGKTPAR